MWPDDADLPVEVWAAFGADVNADPGLWSWTDLSSRLGGQTIQLRAGRSSGAQQTSPGTCSVTLLNDDGGLSPLHPMSPYWPNVDRGTPLKVSLRRAEDSFARTVSSGWGAAGSGQAWTTGGTAAADFSVSGGVARHAHATVNNIRRTTLATSLADSEQVVDVATSALLTGAAMVTGFLFRYQDPSNYYWLRCEFNAGGTSVMLKISKCVTGGFTDLAVLNPVPSLPYAANSYLRVRASVVGSKLALKAWNPAGAEPAGWHVTATDTSIAAAGATGLQSWLVLGNTNTLPVTALHKNYALRVDRFTGFADQWEPTFLPIRPGESASAVRVTASGLLRRLAQGDRPIRSALYRAVSATGPVAYWPLEDGRDASRAASAIPGGPDLTLVRGSVSFAETDGPAGSEPLADFSSGGTMQGLVPAASTSTVWRVEFVTLFRTFTPGTFGAVLQIFTGGTIDFWEIDAQQQADGGLYAQYQTKAGGFDAIYSNVKVDDQRWHHFRVDATQSGANISFTVKLDGATIISWSVPGTMGAVTKVVINPTGDVLEEVPSLGHLAVWAPYAGATDTVAATSGYVGETAAARIQRLCGEEGIPVSVTSTAGEPQGPQPLGPFLELLQGVEETDLGVLTEQGWGLAYRPREDRYNSPVAMTIDLASYKVSGRGGDVLSPTLDDQDVVNEVTASRVNGSSSTALDVAHQRLGRYQSSVELNVTSDGVLPDHASFRVALGTVRYLREQAFPIDLAANPELVDGWLSCRVGARILRTNPPAQFGADPLDRLVEGWSETIGSRSWLVQVNPSPASPWDVATVDGGQRVAADGTTLAAATPSATWGSFLMQHTAENGLWTTNPADFPLLVMLGGELVSVSGITTTGTLQQNATGVTRSLNGVVRTWPAGTPVDVAQPAVSAL